MKISLVIPAHNEEFYIGTCLEHVIKNSQGKLYEIIVIDNASSDKTRETALRYPGVKVVHESNKGLTKARERGLREAQGDYIAYIDADTRMPSQWIEIAEKTLASHPEIMCLSGPYRYYDGSFWIRNVMTILWYISAPIMYRLVGYMVLGGNFIAKKSALISAGSFNPAIDFYGEDTDIARRLHTVGKVLFRMDFFIYSSSRRLAKEGLIMTNIRYALNFIWEVIFHRPFTKKSTDIRIKH